LESVQVASEEVIQSVAPLVVTGYELQQNASCGIEDSISVSSSSAPPFFADINEDLQAGRIVPDSVMCTTCSQVEQYGTVVDLANCLVEVETQFRNENGVWGKLTKEDQSAFEDQVNLAYHIASLGGKDPSLALPLKFIKFFFVESNGPGNRKGN
ncbi:MAG: hypothetical protein KDD35_10255, partial [Bdellovibrionales bacterium]|nr:hypothetical protein [Bdellovibrionales bacterium]